MRKFTYFAIVALLSAFGCNNSANSSAAGADSTVQAPRDPADWALIPFTKIDSVNPVLSPGSNSFTDPIRKKKILWEEKDVFNPATVVRDGKIYMLYRAQDKIGQPAGTSRIGLAESVDGYHFVRRPSPVLYPGNDAEKKYEWEGGCEDPRVVQDMNGTYFMTYTAFDGDKARLMVASSPDLYHWKKHGLAFGSTGVIAGKPVSDLWSKS